MMSGVWWPLRAVLFSLPPEAAHAATIAALRLAPRFPRAPSDSKLEQRVWGLDFPNPLGMAAGFDKNAAVPDALHSLGFGHVEVGTVTPRPQTGNPSPRVFRLPSDRALINRLGFNNEGHAAVLARLRRRGSAKGGTLGIIGVNIGANKDSADRVADFVAGLCAFNAVADYFTVNISSPNTPGLRDLQAPTALAALLLAVTTRRRDLVAQGGAHRPIIVKLAPDLADGDLPAIIEVLNGSGIDGIAIANTTLARTGLRHEATAREAGGLSGAPLFRASTRMLAQVHQLTGGQLPLIGIGGISSGADAVAKIEAGATLLQLYTGLIYEGPGLIGSIDRAISERLARDRIGLAELRGRTAKAWVG